MIHILITSPSGDFLQTHDVEILKKHFNQEGYHIWVDLDEPNESELQILKSVFHFHPHTIKDVKKQVGTPKLSLYDKYAFLMLHRLFYQFETETCDAREFEVYLSDHYLVTIHLSHLTRTFSNTREMVKENPKETLGHSISHVLYHLLENTIRDYLPMIERWQDELEAIEQKVLKGAKEEILDEILQFKKLVATMRRSLLPEREAIRQLSEKTNSSFVGNEGSRLFKSVLDDMNGLLHELDNLKDHAASVFDVYAAMLTIRMTEASNQLNFVMQRLTIAATIFLPLTFIVGVYGMNFEYLPELHWKYGYYIIWGLMAAITGGLIYFFKRKKWI